MVTGALLAACSERADLAAETVRVELPDRTVELDVISCGLDDDVFVLGASSADVFVQILLVTIDDDAPADDDEEPTTVTVDVESSAFSVEVAREGVLGAGSADLLQVRPGVSGEIESASIRGDRVEIEGDARALDGGPGDASTPVSLEARCPAVDDFV